MIRIRATRYYHHCKDACGIRIERVALAEPPRHERSALSDLICTWGTPLLPAGRNGRPLPLQMKNPAAFFFQKGAA